MTGTEHAPADDERTPTGALRSCTFCRGTGLASVAMVPGVSGTARLIYCPCLKADQFDGEEASS